MLKNTNDSGRMVVSFEKLQFITTGEKVIGDSSKKHWLLCPSTAEEAEQTFFLQLSENSPESGSSIKAFQDLVETNSDRIIALKATSFLERQIWVEVIGSVIYLNLIRKIQQANRPNNPIDWARYDFFTLLDKVDF